MIVKLSHSILSAWEQGRHEDAVAYYLGKDIPPTPQMKLGRVKDELWSDYATKNNQHHDEVGGGLLDKPKVQQKYEKIIPFSDDIHILLRGVVDVYDKPIIYDYKCGKTEATTYVDKQQMKYYKLLIPEAQEARYLCYNPYMDSLKIGVEFLDDKSAEAALEHILTFGGEMINYLQSIKRLKDYSKEAKGEYLQTTQN